MKVTARIWPLVLGLTFLVVGLLLLWPTFSSRQAGPSPERVDTVEQTLATAAPEGDLAPARPVPVPAGSSARSEPVESGDAVVTTAPEPQADDAPSETVLDLVPEDHADVEGLVIDPEETVSPRDEEHAEFYSEYQQVGEEFLAVFARPAEEVSSEQWWAQVEPFLAERVVEDYAGTDPQQVPFTTVTGEAVVVPSEAPTNLSLIVAVPTDQGDYLVEMETDPDGIWVTHVRPSRGGDRR